MAGRRYVFDKEACEKWKKQPDVNPFNRFPIAIGTKYGVWAQANRQCNKRKQNNNKKQSRKTKQTKTVSSRPKRVRDVKTKVNAPKPLQTLLQSKVNAAKALQTKAQTLLQSKVNAPKPLQTKIQALLQRKVNAPKPLQTKVQTLLQSKVNAPKPIQNEYYKMMDYIFKKFQLQEATSKKFIIYGDLQGSSLGSTFDRTVKEIMSSETSSDSFLELLKGVRKEVASKVRIIFDFRPNAVRIVLQHKTQTKKTTTIVLFRPIENEADAPQTAAEAFSLFTNMIYSSRQRKIVPNFVLEPINENALKKISNNVMRMPTFEASSNAL